MGIQKAVELADFAEKNAKRIRILKNESSNVFVRPSELKPFDTMYFCYANPKRKESSKCHCVFECF